MPPLSKSLLVTLAPPSTVPALDLLDELNLPPHIKKHALAGLHKSNITESQSILSPETCAKLREQVDDHFTANHDSVDNGPDYQRKLTRPELTAFLGADADTFWSRIPTSSQTRIFIRRYTPSTRPWIPFHTDSSFLTINVALNSPSEYTGGALLALALGRVVAIGGRTAGSVTQHDSTLLHGVTRMVTGTRYTLIVFVGTCHARVEELMFREGCEGERVALVELLEGTRVMEEVLGKERTEEIVALAPHLSAPAFDAAAIEAVCVKYNAPHLRPTVIQRLIETEKKAVWSLRQLVLYLTSDD